MELTHEFRVPVPVGTTWDVLTDVERIAPCLPGAQLQEIEGDEYRGIVKVKVGPITAQYKGAATFVQQDRDAGRMVLHAEGRDTRGQGSAAADITAVLDDDGGTTRVVVTTELKITGKVAQFGRGVIADVSSKLLDQFVECLESTVLADAAEPEPDPGAEPAVSAEPEVVEPVSEESAAEASVSDGPEVVESAAGASVSAQPEVVEPAAEASVSAEPEVVEPAREASPDVTAAPAAGGEQRPAPPPESPAVRKISSPEPQPVDLLDSAGAPLLKRAAPVLVVLVILILLGRRRRASGGS